MHRVSRGIRSLIVIGFFVIRREHVQVFQAEDVEDVGCVRSWADGLLLTTSGCCEFPDGHDLPNFLFPVGAALIWKPR